MTSLHPPSFHRNDFSTFSTHFHSFFGGIFVFAPRARRFMHAHAHADNAPHLRTCKARACYGVVQCLPMKSPTIYRQGRRFRGGRGCSSPPTSSGEGAEHPHLFPGGPTSRDRVRAHVYTHAALPHLYHLQYLYSLMT